MTVFYQVAKKSGHNDEVTVLPRWPEGGVSLYFQREAQSIHMGTGALRRAKGGDINNLIPKSPQDAKINLISRIYSTTFLLKQYYSLVISF